MVQGTTSSRNIERGGRGRMKVEITIDEVELAHVYAWTAHHGQTDKRGDDYFWHLCRVAGRCKTPQTKAVAYLHDILEDTPVQIHQLMQLFTKETVEAVKVLTRDDDDTYERYIQRVVASKNRLAIVVKANDIEDHLRDTTYISDELINRYNLARVIIYQTMLDNMTVYCGRA